MSQSQPIPERLESAGGSSSRVAEVLRLFREELRDVSFPDVSSSVLEQHNTDLAQRQAAVEAARARLREAEASLDQARRELSELTERAVAYARVYAAGHPTLEQALDRLTTSRPRAKGARRREPAREAGGHDNGLEQRSGAGRVSKQGKQESPAEGRTAGADSRQQLALA